MTAEQLGIWLGGLFAVAVLFTAVVAAFRIMTKNFVSKDELTAAMLQLKDSIKSELDTTRHTLRNEMQAGFVKWDLKIDNVTAGQSDLRTSLARIEAVLYVRGRLPDEPNNH